MTCFFVVFLVRFFFSPSSPCPFKLWILAKMCLHVDELKRFESAVISAPHGMNKLQGLDQKKIKKTLGIRDRRRDGSINGGIRLQGTANS